MLGSYLKKVFGSANDRRLKGYRPEVAAINALEPEFAALSDEQLHKIALKVDQVKVGGELGVVIALLVIVVLVLLILRLARGGHF